MTCHCSACSRGHAHGCICAKCEQSRESSRAWAAFLSARAELLKSWKAEGKTDQEIARHLYIDVAQVRRIIESKSFKRGT